MENESEGQSDESAQADQVDGEALESQEDEAKAQPAEDVEVLVARRLEGGTSSPVMPWGTGPRPEGYADDLRNDSCPDCEAFRAAHAGKAGAESHVCAKHAPAAEGT
jgi:hypothetical protein